MRKENLFDLEEAKKTNAIISGASGSGKTRLGSAIASLLHRLNFTVQAFDSSGEWKKVSDLPFVSKVYRHKNQLAYAQLEGSGIFDLSLLTRNETKKIVETETRRIWEERAVRAFNNPMWLIFEESEIYLRQLEENVYRVLHSGRNLGIRAILLTTDLSYLAGIIRLCEIRFHGHLPIEENAKRKFRAYYGKDWCRIATEGLDVGDFIRLHKKKLSLISVPLFERKHAPRLLFPKPQTEPQSEPRKDHWARKSLEQQLLPIRIIETLKSLF